MKILRIEGWEGPTAGGAETYVGRVTREMRRRGHEELVVAITTHPANREKLGIDREYVIPGSTRSRAFRTMARLEDRRMLSFLDDAAREIRPDVIHLHSFRHNYVDLASWIENREEPVLFTVHNVEMICPVATLTLPDGRRCEGEILPRCAKTGCEVGHGLGLNLLKKDRFNHRIAPRLSGFICVSDATRMAMERLGYLPTRMLRPMIPVPDQEPGQKQGGPFTVGYLGRLERQKGIDTLISAFDGAVRRKIPNAVLRVAGSGSVSIRTEAGAVEWTGWVESVTEWLAGIDVLVVPSLPWENLGNSAIEALGHAVPVIVTNSGGLPEAVGDFGTVVQWGDARALSEAILRVASRLPEEKLRARAGREWVRTEFATGRHISTLLEIYADALREDWAKKMHRYATGDAR